MLLQNIIELWKTKEGEKWFIHNLTKLVSEIQHSRDFSFHDQYEEVLWEIIDIINYCPWSESTQLTFVELAMDASLLIGSRDLFNEFFEWFVIHDNKSLARHKGAKIFISSLDSALKFQENIKECQIELEDSMKGEVDIKWTSLSLIALVDLAHRYLPMSPSVPEALFQSLYDLFRSCGIEWFINDLFALNPNSQSWIDSRNEILQPWYIKFMVTSEPQTKTIVTTNREVLEHSYLLNSQGITLPVNQIIIEAKNRNRTLQNTEAIWKSLERGTAVITNYSQLDTYLVSYGTKHLAKLDYVLGSNYGKFSPKQLIDWGCGQGLGALSLLNRFGHESGLREIVLIEPSYFALNRAEYLVRRHKHGANISVKSLNGYFESNTFNNLNFSGATIHIFSNVLDIENINIKKTAELIVSRFTGPQLFFLISPFISRARSTRLLTFQNIFTIYSDYTEHQQIENDFIVNGNATITARVFSCILP